MCDASASLPSVSLPDWGLSGPPCRFLTGDRFFHQTIFCARSFEWACDTHLKLEIFSDGTLRSEHRKAIRRALPHATIIEDSATIERLDKFVPTQTCPYLREMREGHPLMRKLLDLHAGFIGPSIHLDSDMLFFNTPDVIKTWVRDPQGEFFMQQAGDGLVDERNRLEHDLNQRLLTGVNTGIVAVDDSTFDWPALEYAVQRLSRQARAHPWAEQTLFAFHLSRRNAVPLPMTEYMLCHSRYDLASPLPVLRHYVHKAKWPYVTGEWLRWLKLSRTASNVLSFRQ